ncbi:MAG: YfhO family protein [Ruminococcus sp.]|nr:YfhO family protein [Ruminococcus sp.]
MKNALQYGGTKTFAQRFRGLFANRWIYLTIFLIPVVVMYTVYAFHGVHPFSTNSVLVLDLNGQYVYYYEAFRDYIHGGDNFFYNWSRNLSGEMFGVFAYYLASPFMIIICLLPRTWMCGAIETLQLLKMGTAAVTFAFFLRRTAKPKNLSLVVFSSCYSLMTYMIVELMNPMWLDGLILLPLICLGVHRLVDKGKLLPFVIPLALVFIAHFYIGYMIGIFTFMYFLFYCFTKKRRIFPEHFFRSIVCFALGTLTALLCAAIVLIPVYNSLKLGKFEFTEPDYSLATQFDFLTVITKMFPLTYDSVNVEGLPMIYCGTITVFLIPLFFMNKRIYIKKKVGLGVLASVLLAFMYIRPADMVWHGFQMPNWIPFRYSFALSFVFLLMAFEAFENIRGVTAKEIGGAFFGIIVFLFWCERENYEHFQIFESFGPNGKYTIPQGIWGAMLAMVVYFAVLYQLRKKRRVTKIMSVFVCILIVGELTINTMDTVKKCDMEVAYSKYTSYEPYMSNLRDVVSKVKEADKEPFYRMEATFHRTVNDPIGSGYYGVSHSSSTMNSPVLTMLDELGFGYGGHSTTYIGKTYITDALFDIKYVMDKKDSDGENHYQSRDVSVPKEYDLVKTIQEDGAKFKIYQNPYAIGLGVAADNRITEVKLDENNPFENQNMILSALTSKQDLTQYFTRIKPYDHQTENLKVGKLSDGHKWLYYEDEDKTECHVDFLIEMDKTSDLYMYLPSVYQRICNVWVQKESEYGNGSNEMKFMGQFYDGDCYAIMNLGKYESGEKVRVRVTVANDENAAYWTDELFYSFDMDKFEADIAEVQKKTWNVTEHKGGHVKGEITVDTDDQLLFTTIPQENGWTVKVNGKQVETKTSLDCLITIPLEKGKNVVTMDFSPNYFKLAIIVSIAGLLIVMIIFIFQYKQGVIINKILRRQDK